MIVYTYSAEDISADLLTGFFVGWPNPPTTETHLKLLQRSDHVALAIDDKSGMVVGFVTAISDGVLSAYLPLLEVLPEYQGRGIGSKLMRRMLEALDGLYMIDLMCDQPMMGYYEQLGFGRAHGMSIRNYDHQSGKS